MKTTFFQPFYTFDYMHVMAVILYKQIKIIFKVWLLGFTYIVFFPA